MENNTYAEQLKSWFRWILLGQWPLSSWFSLSLSLNCDCSALRGSELSKLQYKCFAPMGFTTSINRPKHSMGFTCDSWQVRAIITSLRHRSGTEQGDWRWEWVRVSGHCLWLIETSMKTVIDGYISQTSTH